MKLRHACMILAWLDVGLTTLVVMNARQEGLTALHVAVILLGLTVLAYALAVRQKVVRVEREEGRTLRWRLWRRGI